MIKEFELFDNEKAIKRLTFLIGATALFLLIFSGLFYAISTWFRISHIVVVGQTAHITDDNVAFIVKNRLEGTFFTLDINQLQHEFAKVPWIKSVSITRNFPDTITVELQEHKALARLKDGRLVSKDGAIFMGSKDALAEVSGLPVFDVSDNNIAQALTDYGVASQYVAQLGSQVESVRVNTQKVEGADITSPALSVPRVVSIAIGSGGLTQISLSTGVQIVICGVDLASKFAVLTKYWQELHNINNKFSYVNMCYKNALAINGMILESKAI